MALTPDELALVRETVERAMADTLPDSVAELRRQRDALLTAAKKLDPLLWLSTDVQRDALFAMKRGIWSDAIMQHRDAIALCEQTPDPK